MSTHEMSHQGSDEVAALRTRIVELEQSLAESEDRGRLATKQFDALFERSAIGSALASPDGRWVKVNQALCDQLGYTQTELSTSSWQELSHPDDLAESLAALQAFSAGNIDHIHLEKRFLHKQGHTVWMVVTISRIIDKNGQSHFIGQMQDITHHKRTEAELKQINAELEQRVQQRMTQIETSRQGLIHMLDGLGDGFIVIDDQWCFAFINAVSEGLLGSSETALLGKNIWEAFPVWQNSLFGQECRRVMEHGVAVTIEDYSARLNRWFQIRIFPTRNSLFVYCIDITEHRDAENKLKDSQRFIEQVRDAIPDLTFQLTREGIVLDYHQPSDFPLFVPEDQFLGKSLLDVMPPEQSARLAYFIDQALQTGLVQTHDYQLPIQGKLRSYQSRITSMGDGTVLAILRDITPLRNAAATLQSHNEYLTVLHETALALMNRLNVEDLLEFIVEQAATLLDAQLGSIHLIDPDGEAMTMRVGVGLSRPGIGSGVQRNVGMGGKVWEMGAPFVLDDYLAWEGHLESPVVTQLHSALGVPLTSGDTVVGVLSLGRNTENTPFSHDEVTLIGQFAALASIALDNAQLYTAAQNELTERKRVEEALLHLNMQLEHRVHERTAEVEREQSRLKTVLDTMGEGLIYVHNLHISYANNAFAQMVGFTVDEIVGEAVNVLKPDHLAEKQLSAFQQMVAPVASIWRGETEIRRHDNSTFVAALTVSKLPELNGRGAGAVITIRDITVEKRFQSQKNQFITNASHELRTPLTNFTTRLYLIKKQPDQLPHHIATLERIVSHMTSIVEDLLDISRFERGVITLRRRDIVLQDVISEVISLQQSDINRKNIAFTTDIAAEPLNMNGDMNRLVQVVLNLVSNAVSYTAEGGQLSVRLSEEFQEGKRYATITVKDTGIGIAPAHLPQLFEPFFRINELESRGIGLGLAITKEIVELHGGDITVDSELGVGSVFTIKLPLSQPGDLPIK